MIAGSRTFRTFCYRNVVYRVIQKLIEPERANRLAGKNFEKWVARYSGVLSKLPLDSLLQNDRHGVARLLTDDLAEFGLHWQFMPAVAQGHKGALEWMPINLAPDL